MKNIIVLTIGFFIAVLGFSNPLQAQTDKDEITVQVDGLGCPFCAYGLEKKFKEFKGIKNVAIEMETGVMTFDFPAKDSLAIEQIEEKVVDAGYTPVSVEIMRAGGVFETSQKEEMETAEGESIETTLFVAGNCGMCQARIEKAANDLDGVTEASWDKENKELSVLLNTSQTSLEELSATVAKAGHDTKTAKAEKGVYEKLPGCCQYERVD